MAKNDKVTFRQVYKGTYRQLSQERWDNMSIRWMCLIIIFEFVMFWLGIIIFFSGTAGHHDITDLICGVLIISGASWFMYNYGRHLRAKLNQGRVNGK